MAEEALFWKSWSECPLRSPWLLRKRTSSRLTMPYHGLGGPLLDFVGVAVVCGHSLLARFDAEMDEFADLTPEERVEQDLGREYGELYDELTRILFFHDPVGLIAIGAPADEYSPEVDALLPHLQDFESPVALNQFVYETFVRMFSRDMMERDRARFATLAQDIWGLTNDGAMHRDSTPDHRGRWVLPLMVMPKKA